MISAMSSVRWSCEQQRYLSVCILGFEFDVEAMLPIDTLGRRPRRFVQRLEACCDVEGCGHPRSNPRISWQLDAAGLGMHLSMREV